MKKPDSVRVSLPLFEQPIEIAKPRGRGSLMMLLPAARQLSASVLSASIDEAKATGETPSCRAGCDACCRHLIPVSAVEAIDLVRTIGRMPPASRDKVRARFKEILSLMEAEGMVEPESAAPRSAIVSRARDAKAQWHDVSSRYFDMHIDCPFLASGRCSIYADRPFACRDYNATTPAELCAKLDEAVTVIPRHLRMNEVLASLTVEIGGGSTGMVPLPLALELASIVEGELDKNLEADDLVEAFVSKADELYE